MDSMRIENHILRVLEAVPVPDRYQRDPGIAHMQVIHRLGIDRLCGSFDATPVDIARWYHDHPEAKTDRLMPYHFLVRKTGAVQQCLPLSLVGNGAKKLNRNGIQIAVEGDFREETATPKQAFGLSALCLALYKLGATTIIGHTDCRGCSDDANKVCPGPRLVIDGLRLTVRSNLRSEALDYAHKVRITI